MELDRAGFRSLLLTGLLAAAPAAAQVWPPGALGAVDLIEDEGVGHSLAISDFDADGFLDLAYGHWNDGRGSVWVMRTVGRDLEAFGTVAGTVAGAECGDALAAGHFASDPGVLRPHLAISYPGVVSSSGVVQIYRVRASDGQVVLVRQLNEGFEGLPGTAEDGDRFGDALAVGDFDGDGADDLAIGVPGEDLNALPNAGAVIVLYGATDGLDPSTGELWTQNTAGVPDDNEADDSFGASLVAGDFDGDDFDDLAIGAPFETVAGQTLAGAVTILYGTAGGLATAGAQWLTQGDGVVPGGPEAFDRFGLVLAAGRVVSDDGTGGPGADEDDLLIGVPYESVGATAGAGAIVMLVGRAGGFTSAGALLVTQADLPGTTPEDSDHFGAALAVADFSHDGWRDVAVGSPDEDANQTVDHGAVEILFGGRTGIVLADTQLVLPRLGFPLGAPGEGDRFASVLAGGDLDGDGHADLAIGTPDWDYRAPNPDTVDAGHMMLLYGARFADDFEAGDPDAWSFVAP